VASNLGHVRDCGFRHKRSFRLLLAVVAQQTAVAALEHRTFLLPVVDLVGEMVFESCTAPAHLEVGKVAFHSPGYGLAVATACALVGCRKRRSGRQRLAEDLLVRRTLHLRLFFLLLTAQGLHRLSHMGWARATFACLVPDLSHLLMRSC
jgi:hypothetical protein